MKQNPDSCLHSGLIGTESIRNLLPHRKVDGSLSVSPLSAKKVWKTERFTKEEVMELFDQFAEDKNLDLLNIQGGDKH
jgi:hypothetical protein